MKKLYRCRNFDRTKWSGSIMEDLEVLITKDDQMEMSPPASAGSHSRNSSVDRTKTITPHFNSEMWKLVMSFLHAVFCGCICAYSVIYGNDSMPLDAPPLRDIVFEKISPQFWALHAAEGILMFQSVLCIVIALAHKRRLVVFRRFFFIFGTVYLLRAVCLFSTTLTFPEGDMKCVHSKDFSERMSNFLQVVNSAGITFFSQARGFCGNYFFSGHTIIITLQYLVIQDYTPKCMAPLRFLVSLSSFSAAVFMIISRGHYTIDIIAAYYVTTRMWWNYHAIAWNANSRNPRSYPPANEFWYRLALYYEENTITPGQETNELCTSPCASCGGTLPK